MISRVDTLIYLLFANPRLKTLAVWQFYYDMKFMIMFRYLELKRIGYYFLLYLINNWSRNNVPIDLQVYEENRTILTIVRGLFQLWGFPNLVRHWWLKPSSNYRTCTCSDWWRSELWTMSEIVASWLYYRRFIVKTYTTILEKRIQKNLN